MVEETFFGFLTLCADAWLCTANCINKNFFLNKKSILSKYEWLLSCHMLFNMPPFPPTIQVISYAFLTSLFANVHKKCNNLFIL